LRQTCSNPALSLPAFGLVPKVEARLVEVRLRPSGGSGSFSELSNQGASVKAPKFSYVCAESVVHAVELLAEHGEDARILAGGQSLMPTLNMRLSQPRLLIDINRIEELKGISLRDGEVRIGALARHAEVATSLIVAEHLPLITEAMPHVAHVAVRNRGTFGGSIALADPAAEMPACALALGATFILESAKGRREIPSAMYFKGLYETARRPDELLIEALLPVKRPQFVSVFMELARRQGDFAIAGLAFQLLIDDGVVHNSRLVCFGSEEKPTLARRMAAAIRGTELGSEAVDAAVAAVGEDLRPMSNSQGSAKMRLHLQRVLTRRALLLARQRAGVPA
jgi:carbon-monoxide dehydrogenase medium subunit